MHVQLSEVRRHIEQQEELRRQKEAQEKADEEEGLRKAILLSQDMEEESRLLDENKLRQNDYL